MSDVFQSQVAKIALSAAASHGFALGGGHALIVHGIVSRSTEDIDLFTNSDGGVQSATPSVEAGLARAGMGCELVPSTTELGDVFYGFDQDFVELEIRSANESVRLTLARFDRIKEPVTLEIGPVLHLDDVLGSKVAAMATRAEPRDFVDVSAALQRFQQSHLIELAKRSDPALTDDELAEAMVALDHIPDGWFLRWIKAEGVARLRQAFADWPRA
jgi:hypothetical protein